MPAPVAPLLGFSLGAAFAWAASDDLARSSASSLASRALAIVSLFALLVYAPVCAYFLAFCSDWSFAYLFDTDRLPAAVPLALVLLDLASVPAGFLAAAGAAGGRRLPSVVRIAVAPIVASMVFLAATLPRLGVSATYAQYHGDFGTRSLAGSPVGWALLWMTAVLAGATAWTVRALRRRATRR